MNAKVKEEIEKVNKLPFVKEVKVLDDIYINIGKIYITAEVTTGKTKTPEGIEALKREKKRIEIGELRIIIKDGEIMIENLTRTILGRFSHPHANMERICFGQGDATVTELINSFELEKLIIFMYGWANSYEQTDAFCNIQEFYNQLKKEGKIE